jgi:beta-glucosidase
MSADKKTKKSIGKVKAIIIYSLCAVFVAATIVGNIFADRYKNLISVYFNQPTQKIVAGEAGDSQYFASDFTSEEEKATHLRDVGTQISAEGSVLLKNDGAVLPLNSDAKISVFGQDSADPLYGGGGAGSIDPAKAVSLKAGLEAAGFTLNPTLWDFYEKGAGKSYRKTVPDVYGQGAFSVNEVPLSAFTDTVKGSFKDYSDAAVVVVGRAGGESSDLATALLDSGSYYLQLDKDELDTLQLACDNFDKVVVLLNTENPVELGFLNEFDVDACLWIGALGETGSLGIGQILAGEVNPSGALPDTYAYSSFSAPAMENFGAYSFANSEMMWGNTYMVYGEGIYVGYRYYETRYEDVVLGNETIADYDYATVVQYPFGYGQSYTDFAWSDFTSDEEDDAYKLSLTVENTGSVAGKDIAQAYFQSPYTQYDKDNGIEKASVELAGFAKTSLLQPGESETVTITVDKESMKVFDANDYKTYILDAGDYYLAVGNNAHDAANNILAAKGKSVADGMDYDGDAGFAKMFTINELDATTYAVSSVTGNEVGVAFDDVDIKYYDPNFQYLSRSDWNGTWPTTYKDGSWEAPAELLSALELSYTEDSKLAMPETGVIDEDYGRLSVAMLRETEYDNELWDTLIAQMSVSELDTLVRIGGYATNPIESIALPSTEDKDGPAGISGTLVGGSSGTGYPPATVLASTFNVELAREFGKCIGEDSLTFGVTGWYAPAADIHRSPYSGRNFEYFSEDGYISGVLCAAVVSGAQEKGVLVYVKHFAVNDQETNRMGGAMFANEQSLRSIYLLPFELAVRDGGAHGVMTAMNRIGTRWVGGHTGLMTTTLRDEWGFEGLAITDQASFDVFSYEDLREGLEAGNDLWLNTDAELWKLSDAEMTPTIIRYMQRSAKNIAFAISRSNAMNGLTSDAKIVSITPLWQIALIILSVIIFIATVLVAVFVTRRGRKSKATTEAVSGGATSGDGNNI